ncbi:MAG: MFS transporter [Thermoplasmataceae archaeon]|jgi:MFS family permease
MVKYKWVALSNTTIGVLMASINGTIILISLPAILGPSGININPTAPGTFIYLIWLIMGYNIITAVILLTLGRLSDIFGRTKLFNLGFVIFTVGSVLLFLTPSKGDTGALELIIFRLIQGLGSAFLFANSTAILTDAFPLHERGKALGLNQVAALGGSFVGLILGGVLAVYDWRYVFLVSVPIGILGTVWSLLKLQDHSVRDRNQKIDYAGNIIFGVGVTIFLLGLTYGLLPPSSGTGAMDWSSPWVIAALAGGAFLLVLFPFVEKKIKQPMFKLSLFRIRAFAFGNLASLLASLGRGGVMFMLIILLQGIWLPIHLAPNIPYIDIPFWAGIYMVPMTLGFLTMGPLGGALSDRYGARGIATIGMVIVAAAFIILTFFSANFTYIPFGATLYMMGFGSGMFAAPNTAAIMNSVSPDNRGIASGMVATVRNVAQTASLGIFFTIVIFSLSTNLPGYFSAALTTAGAPQLIPFISKTPPTEALFSAFLGYNPMVQILTGIQTQAPSVYASLSQSAIGIMTARSWFSYALAPAVMQSLRDSFYIGAVLSGAAAVLSALRGKRYVHHAVPGEEDPSMVKGESDKLTLKQNDNISDNPKGGITDK